MLKSHKKFHFYFPIFLSIVLLCVVVIFVWQRAYMEERENKTKPLEKSIDAKEVLGQAQKKLYKDSDLNFSFKYSPDLFISRFYEGEGLSVLIKNSSETLAQIYVTEFDEPGPVTQERIHRDLPDKEVTEPRTEKVGGVAALVFSSKDDSGLLVKERWFVNNGFLYRVTTSLEQEKTIQEILNTWEYDK